MNSNASRPPTDNEGSPKTNIEIIVPHYPGGHIPKYGLIPEIPSRPPRIAHRQNVSGLRGRARIERTVILPLHIRADVDPKKIKREFAYIVTWTDSPATKLTVPGTEILDYVTPRTLEDFEHGEWLKREAAHEEAERKEKEEAERKSKAKTGSKKGTPAPAADEKKKKRGRSKKNTMAILMPPPSPPRPPMMMIASSLSTPQKLAAMVDEEEPREERTEGEGENDMDTEDLEDVMDTDGFSNAAALGKQIDDEMDIDDYTDEQELYTSDDDGDKIKSPPRKRSRGVESGSSSRDARPSPTPRPSRDPMLSQVTSPTRPAIRHEIIQNLNRVQLSRNPGRSSTLHGSQREAAIKPQPPAARPVVKLATPFLLAKNKVNPSPHLVSKSAKSAPSYRPLPPRSLDQRDRVPIVPPVRSLKPGTSRVLIRSQPSEEEEMDDEYGRRDEQQLIPNRLVGLPRIVAGPLSDYVPLRSPSPEPPRPGPSFSKAKSKPAPTSLPVKPEPEVAPEVVEHGGGDHDVEETWEVEALEADKWIDGHQFYLVRWKGDWPSDQNPTWEPKENISRPAVREYLKKKKNRRGKKESREKERQEKKTKRVEGKGSSSMSTRQTKLSWDARGRKAGNKDVGGQGELFAEDEEVDMVGKVGIYDKG